MRFATVRRSSIIALSSWAGWINSFVALGTTKLFHFELSARQNMSSDEKVAVMATERRGSENYPEHHKGRVEQVHADGTLKH